MFVFVDGEWPKLINPSYVSGFDLVPYHEDDGTITGYSIAVVYTNGTTTLLQEFEERLPAVAKLRALQHAFNKVMN